MFVEYAKQKCSSHYSNTTQINSQPSRYNLILQINIGWIKFNQIRIVQVDLFVSKCIWYLIVNENIENNGDVIAIQSNDINKLSDKYVYFMFVRDHILVL